MIARFSLGPVGHRYRPNTLCGPPRIMLTWHEIHAALIATIDHLVATRVPDPDASAPIHTESVGAVIDRMAATAALALYQLATLGGADPVTHQTWTRLATLELAYSDLAVEITAGRKRLPRTDIHPR